MNQQNILFTNNTAQALDTAINNIRPNGIFVLTDKNTAVNVWPQVKAESMLMSEATLITINPGDTNKDLKSATLIWENLINGGATRHSAMICLGGGMITDIGGFTASTFKRGIKFINMPTTLLSAVDAAVGGKTGINFNGLKNEIGVFSPASHVIISTRFFNTLQKRELLSGYAEMLKHGLIDSAATFHKLIDSDPLEIDAEHMLELLKASVEIKRRIVNDDPYEQGIRRALNLGHTAGHALESLAMKKGKPVPHGYAVAWGCIIELILSHTHCGFPTNTLRNAAQYIFSHYGTPDINCSDYQDLLEFMHHDKKNISSECINFTMLSNVGRINIDRTATESEIKTALDIFRDLAGA